MRLALVCVVFVFAPWQRAVAQSAPHASSASPQAPSSAQLSPKSLPADLPLRRDESSPSMGSAGYVVWLLAVIAAMAVLWAVRSRQGNSAGWLMKLRSGDHEPALKLLATRQLGPSSSLQVVKWADKEFLLGCTPQSISVLDSRDALAGRREAV